MMVVEWYAAWIVIELFGVLFKFWILVRSAYDSKEKKKKEKKKRIEERRHDATKDNGRNENERVCMVGCLKP